MVFAHDSYLLPIAFASKLFRGRHVPNSVKFVSRRILDQIKQVHKAQESLDKKFTENLDQLRDLAASQRAILRELTRLTGRVEEEDDLIEDDPMPGSDWTLDSQEQSQQLVPRIRHRRYFPDTDHSQDPYTPSLESQIEAVVNNGGEVRGRPPCISPETWSGKV